VGQISESKEGTGSYSFGSWRTASKGIPSLPKRRPEGGAFIMAEGGREANQSPSERGLEAKAREGEMEKS